MNFIIKSVKGKLYYNNDMKDDVVNYLSAPSGISKGCLSIEASIDNILVICEHLLARFVRPGGVFLAPDKKWKGYSGLNVVKSNFQIKHFLLNYFYAMYTFYYLKLYLKIFIYNF